MNLNYSSFRLQNSENTDGENYQGSSTQKKKSLRLTLKPEDFLEDSPPRKLKVSRNLFLNGQFNNSVKKSKPFSGFPVNSANSIKNEPLVSVENIDTDKGRNHKLRFTLKPEDFLDTPPEKNKRKGNSSKVVSHKQKENNPILFVKPKKPAAKAHTSGFSFRKKKAVNTKKSICSNPTESGLRSLSSNPDESQPLLSVDEVGDVLIKKQSVFKERRRFFPSVGSIPKTPDRNRKYPSVLSKPSRRLSTLKRKVISPIQETIAAAGPVQKYQQDNSQGHAAIGDETPPQRFTKKIPQNSLLKKAIKNSIHKDNNCCTPLNSNSSDSQISSIQSFVRMKVASSKKRLLNLTSQRIVYSSPDTDFLNEEKNCDSTEKVVGDIKMTKEKCDKETQTDLFTDLSIAFIMLRESLQKLGMKID